ncbi:MAG: hypothetical protein LKI24_03110 [Acidipropionibacterium sp.]|jgi:hypothetical protein|nr:hypothetical protein [Acidipropionibacterium sp.]
MNGRIAKPVNGLYGTIDGVEITEEVIARLVKNAEDGFPGAKFRTPGRPGPELLNWAGCFPQIVATDPESTR